MAEIPFAPTLSVNFAISTPIFHTKILAARSAEFAECDESSALTFKTLIEGNEATVAHKCGLKVVFADIVFVRY